MSEYFYFQQRWFTTNELTTQYFLPGQGFGNLGGDPKMASNVEIKNGVSGLTSHHGKQSILKLSISIVIPAKKLEKNASLHEPAPG